jgi:hypothetical protein
MTKTMKWLLGGAAALAVAGAAYAIPALAAGNGSGMMAGYGMMGGYGMMQARGGNMAAMHSTMMPLMGKMAAMHDQVMGEVAGLLNMTVEDLTKAMAEGKSLTALAEEKGVAVGEIRAVMTRSMKAFLDQLVEEGSITREQAAQWLGFMEKHLEYCLTGNMGAMMGMMGSAGGGCHGRVPAGPSES